MKGRLVRIIAIILCIVGSVVMNGVVAQENTGNCSTEVAYLSEIDGVHNLYLMNADGTAPRLFGENISDYQWSPDGARIAVSTIDAETRVSLIQIIDFESTSVYQISGGQVEVFNPRWSPNGTQLAFNSGVDEHLQIFIADANGGNIQQLTTDAVDHFIGDWSPDGTQIATTVFDDSGSRLGVIDVNNGSLTYVAEATLTANVVIEFMSWTPDSSAILFNSNLSSGSDLQLHMVFTDNSVVRRLFAQQAFGIEWSSDDTRFLYTSRNLDNTNANLFMMDWRTGEVSLLNQSFTIEHDSLFTGSWSVDNTQIVFERLNNGNYDLFVMAVDGSTIRQVTDTPANEVNPQWRPCVENPA